LDLCAFDGRFQAYSPFSKEPILNRSLSVLLPVHNVQRSLCGSVLEILDLLAELTSRFELVIVDDGSTDGTWDVAQELARSYPQVRLLRFREKREFSRSVHQVIHAVHGDVVISHDGETTIDAGQIARLWRSLTPAAPLPKLMRAKSQTAPRYGASSNRRAQQNLGVSQPMEQCGGFRLLRPGTREELRRSVPTSQNTTRKRGAHSTRVEPPQSAPCIDAADPQARRPNFLSRVTTGVRDFARGE
jgi:cellulose synthase/poly-beta-1,6-N-acetylglucosamine synthase-like glycosyltransferase